MKTEVTPTCSGNTCDITRFMWSSSSAAYLRRLSESPGEFFKLHLRDPPQRPCIRSAGLKPWPVHVCESFLRGFCWGLLGESQEVEELGSTQCDRYTDVKHSFLTCTLVLPGQGSDSIGCVEVYRKGRNWFSGDRRTDCFASASDVWVK